MYKERVLCEIPVRLVGSAPASSANSAAAVDRPTPAAVVNGGAVIFWQERAPAILVNADTCYCENIIVRVVHASHEYSCVAYGPNARSVTLDGCNIMGGTGLRIPYSVDPLRLLHLSMHNCVVRVRCLPRPHSCLPTSSSKLTLALRNFHACTILQLCRWCTPLKVLNSAALCPCKAQAVDCTCHQAIRRSMHSCQKWQALVALNCA